MQRLSNALYIEVATFSATVDPEVGECLRRKVDEFTEILAPIAAQIDPARGPEGGTAMGHGPQTMPQVYTDMDRLVASLDECDRMVQERTGSDPPEGGATIDLVGEFQRVRDLFIDTVAAVRRPLEP